MIDKPGIYDIPLTDYIADPAPEPSLSASIASVLISQSPLHAFVQHPRLNPGGLREESTKADIGTIAHGMLLENDESRIVVIDADDWRTKAAKEARDAAYESGKVPMLAKQERPIRKMVEEARKAIQNSELAEAWANGKAEQTLIWKEGEIWLRSRPDWLANDHSLIIDLKTTTGSAEPMAWMRTMLGLGNDLQAVLGLRGIKAISPKSRCQFVFWVVEQDAPYASSFVGLSPQFLEMSEHKMERAIRDWSDCITTNTWPGFPGRVCWLEPPAYAWTAEQLKGLP